MGGVDTQMGEGEEGAGGLGDRQTRDKVITICVCIFNPGALLFYTLYKADVLQRSL
jgi:hypothetical protein